MANPLNDVQRALGSLAILPDIGRHIAKMAREVTRMRQAVEELPTAIEELRESVDALHRDMKLMVDDVHELRGLHDQIEGLRTDLQRIPFVGGGRRAKAARAAASLPVVEADVPPAAGDEAA